MHRHHAFELVLDLLDDGGRSRGHDGDAADMGLVLGFRDGERLDVVAAPGEQADDPGEHARLVVDDDGQRMGFGRRFWWCRENRPKPAGGGCVWFMDAPVILARVVAMRADGAATSWPGGSEFGAHGFRSQSDMHHADFARHALEPQHLGDGGPVLAGADPMQLAVAIDGDADVALARVRPTAGAHRSPGMCRVIADRCCAAAGADAAASGAPHEHVAVVAEIGVELFDRIELDMVEQCGFARQMTVSQIACK